MGYFIKIPDFLGDVRPTVDTLNHKFEVDKSQREKKQKKNRHPLVTPIFDTKRIAIVTVEKTENRKMTQEKSEPEITKHQVVGRFQVSTVDTLDIPHPHPKLSPRTRRFSYKKVSPSGREIEVTHVEFLLQ